MLHGPIGAWAAHDTRISAFPSSEEELCKGLGWSLEPSSLRGGGRGSGLFPELAETTCTPSAIGVIYPTSFLGLGRVRSAQHRGFKDLCMPRWQRSCLGRWHSGRHTRFCLLPVSWG